MRSIKRIRHNARAFTLVELFVVLAIIGVLVALLLPAVQSARESSRNTSCKNNLKQIGLAIQNYESALNRIPSLWYGTHLDQPRSVLDEFYFHSWQTPLLPALGEGSLYDQIDLSLSPTDPSNQANLNVFLSIMVCPSTPNYDGKVAGIYVWPDSEDPLELGAEGEGTAARTDYEVIESLETTVSPIRNGTFDQRGLKFGIWGEADYDDELNMVKGYRIAKLKDATDGLSKTLLVSERAGRPDYYAKGRAVEIWTLGSGMELHQAAWGISTHSAWIRKHETEAVNDYNKAGFFSFHPQGANVVLADGSIRFLTESMEIGLLNALITRAEGELITSD